MQKKYLIHLIGLILVTIFIVASSILVYYIFFRKKSKIEKEKQNNILKNKDEKIINLEKKVNKLEEESILVKKSYGQYRVLTISLTEELKKSLMNILLENGNLSKGVDEVFADIFKESKLIEIHFNEVIESCIELCNYHVIQNNLTLEKSMRIAKVVSINIPKFVFLVCLNSIFWNFFSYAKYRSQINIVVSENKNTISLVLSINMPLSLPTKHKKDIFITFSNVKKNIAMYNCLIDIDDDKEIKSIKVTIPKSIKQTIETDNVFTAQASNTFN